MLCIAFMILVLTPVLSSTNVSDQDFASLKSHVTQLEQTLTDLQSKSQLQEQKHAAVLSSVLAKLTTTTDELTALRTEQNTTLIELDSMKAMIEEIHNKPGFPRKVSAFQARTKQDTVLLKDDAVLVFDHVITSTDTSYNSSSGVFTAPVNGTYFLYANILPEVDMALAVVLKKGDDDYIRGWTGKDYAAASLNALIYLNEGESVWFTTGDPQKVWGQMYSYIGGFLVAEL